MFVSQLVKLYDMSHSDRHDDESMLLLLYMVVLEERVCLSVCISLLVSPE